MIKYVDAHNVWSSSVVTPRIHLLIFPRNMNPQTQSIAEKLVASYRSSASATKGLGDHFSPQPSLSPITLYRTGRLLYTCVNNDDDEDAKSTSSLIDAFELMMSNLPMRYVQTILLHELHAAYAKLIVSFATSDVSAISDMLGKSSGQISVSSPSWNDIEEGTESLCGLYLSSAIACRYCVGDLVSSSSESVTTHELELVVVSLAWVYDHLSSQCGDGESSRTSTPSIQKCILRALSKLLVYGLVQPTSNNTSEEEMDEQLTTIMSAVQNIQSAGGEYNCAMGDVLEMEQSQDISFVKALCSKFGSSFRPPQLQYLLAMLRSFPSSKCTKPASKQVAPKPNIPTEQPTQSATKQTLADIQIDHIHSILPTLGEGYIEEALKCYNHDVERTLEALLQVSDGDTNNNNIHPRLITLPSNLPRKLKDTPDQYTANVNLHRGATVREDGKEHVARQKQLIREVERQAEEEAYLVENVSRALGGLKVMQDASGDDEMDEFGLMSKDDEYNDDYDDQYDGIGDDGGMAGGIGGMDDGLYDVDVHNVHQKYDRGSAKNEQEMWRKYNRLVKDVDSESAFWVSISLVRSLLFLQSAVLCLRLTHIVYGIDLQEENRNTNREGRPNKSNGGDNRKASTEGDDEEGNQEKQYRGPDKGRGGRVIGPDGRYLPIQRGGKKGRGGGASTAADGTNNNNTQSTTGRGRGGGRGGRGGRGQAGENGGANGTTNTSSSKKDEDGDLSKIQKRRKNDNKAKIGNHHRKDRATKKAAGGMF
jgi:hypothetical protein